VHYGFVCLSTRGHRAAAAVRHSHRSKGVFFAAALNSRRACLPSCPAWPSPAPGSKPTRFSSACIERATVVASPTAPWVGSLPTSAFFSTTSAAAGRRPNRALRVTRRRCLIKPLNVLEREVIALTHDTAASHRQGSCFYRRRRMRSRIRPLVRERASQISTSQAKTSASLYPIPSPRGQVGPMTNRL
jgi:hypothetical protein